MVNTMHVGLPPPGLLIITLLIMYAARDYILILLSIGAIITSVHALETGNNAYAAPGLVMIVAAFLLVGRGARTR
jgi:hypothetical protein